MRGGDLRRQYLRKTRLMGVGTLSANVYLKRFLPNFVAQPPVQVKSVAHGGAREAPQVADKRVDE